MKTIRWGIIGCGAVTEVKSGPGFQKAAGSELVAVMRRDGAKAADYARRHGVARWYDDAEALIADKDVDAVYVATPPGTHELYALKVLAAGKPCYVEKPMTRNGAEARRMVEEFATRGVPLFVAYYRRALPRFLKVKELLDGGALGRIEKVSWVYADGRQLRAEVRAPWRVVAEESGGGNFLDLASHALDLLDFWLGPLTLEDASVRNVEQAYRVEDDVWAEMKAGGVAKEVMVSVSFHGEPWDEFLITGDKGQVRLSCFGNESVRFAHQGLEEIFEIPNPEHVAMPLIQSVVDELLGKGKSPSTGATGLRTQVLMDEILAAYYGGREDGFWKRPWPGTTA